MKIDDVSIRFATSDDLDFVRQDAFIPIKIVERKIDQGEVIVAEWKGELIGYMRLEYLWSLIPYIALISITPEYRRRGVGKAILRFTEAFLRERGHNALYSSSQANESEPQTWHRHVGFEECGIIAGINKDGIGEIFFRKPLK
ncbi:MAG TPA: GNAT family N-acetyltransferase [Blastocatellia bacterium]|jgi:ribosomal protein S18 acetylase RimI-like enzyme|nr:GNAT family N-acetyltransferase [Blastocatellia bacterium]